MGRRRPMTGGELEAYREGLKDGELNARERIRRDGGEVLTPSEYKQYKKLRDKYLKETYGSGKIKDKKKKYKTGRKKNA